MTSKSVLRLTAMLCISTAVLSVPSHAADDSKFDMVGLQLGMTHEQVLEALTAYGIDVSTLEENKSSYAYSDGLKNDYRTTDFLSRIVAVKSSRVDNRQKSDSLVITFSPPPEGGRVVLIERLLLNPADPPTRRQFKEAIYEKYGPPDGNPNGADQWLFGEGTMDCLPHGVPVTSDRNKQTILQKVFRIRGGQVFTDQFVTPQVKGLEECANMLTYKVGTLDDQPATRVSATLVNVQSWVRAELAANAWVDSLRQEAIKKREGSGAKSSL